jgi:hypothetical protein
MLIKQTNPPRIIPTPVTPHRKIPPITQNKIDHAPQIESNSSEPLIVPFYAIRKHLSFSFASTWKSSNFEEKK